MSDKELIKQEIERLKHNTSNAYDLSRFMLLEEIESFIDSLPEEPKKQPKFKIGDTIKGPYNNTFRVKDILDTQYLLQSENGDELNSIEIVDKYSCISEEPVSEDLEEEIENWIRTNHFVFTEIDEIIKTAHHFAEWQKQQMKEALQTEYEKGRFDMREEMMKDAVEGVVHHFPHDELAAVHYNDPKGTPMSIYVSSKGLSAGDRVKIIIVKEKEEK